MVRRIHALMPVLAAVSLGAPCHAQAVNNGETNATPVNTSGGTGRPIQRLLAAPRIDPSTPAAQHIAIHLRSHADTTPASDYRESISIFTLGGTAFSIFEGAIAVDESGNALDSDGVSGADVWGGAAYRFSRTLADVNFDSPYLSGNDVLGPGDRGAELNTFGGLTVNGGNAAARFAFFAGLQNAGASSATNRMQPPTNLDDDPAVEGAKASPLRRGIWSTMGSANELRLRALETDPSRLAPGDPNGLRPLAFPFTRLHPSDYTIPALNFQNQVSLMAEQRFGRVSNLALNDHGELAFRGDIGDLDIQLGISGPTRTTPSGIRRCIGCLWRTMSTAA